MTKKKTSFIVFAIIIFSILSSFQFESYAQGKKSAVQLLSNRKQTPIEGATYIYGSQQGISNAEGNIEISFLPDTILYLSHVSFGQWSLIPDEVLNALRMGVIIRRELVMSVQPVTVLSLHGRQRNDEYYQLGIQEHLAHDAVALLTLTPVVSSIRKSGNYGFDPVIRGFKYDQLNIVIDGVQCASAACPNRMDPPISQVAPNMIQQVEIIKGPYSLRYGNSFGGTINFKTGEPVFAETDRLFGRLSSNYEVNGGIVRSEGVIGNRGKNHELSVFGSYSEGDSYSDGEGIIVPSAFSRGSMGAILNLAVHGTEFLSASISRNFARDTDFPSLPMDLRKDDTWLFNATAKKTFQNKLIRKWSTNIYLTSVDHLMDNFSKILEPRMADALTNANTLNWGGRTELQLELGNGVMYGGADYRLEQAEGIRERTFLMGPMVGKTVFDNAWQKGQISKTGIFGEYQATINELQFMFSARLENNHAQVLDPDENFVSNYSKVEVTQINPGFSFGLTNSLSQNIKLGVWGGRAQRSAGITERYINYFPVGLDPFEMLGNPELKPEVNNQLDLNFEYKTNTSLVEVSLFTSYLTNLITSEINVELQPRMATSPGVRQFTNLDQAIVSGSEIGWTQQLLPNLKHQMSMAFTYGHNLVDDSPLPEIAPLDIRYTLMGEYYKRKVQPLLTVRYVLPQNRISTAFGETQTPDFMVVNASVNYQITKLIGAVVGVQNLFDTAYYEHLSRSVKGVNPRPIYAPGRNVYFSVVFKSVGL